MKAGGDGLCYIWMVSTWAPESSDCTHHRLNPPPLFKERIQKELNGKRGGYDLNALHKIIKEQIKF